MDCDYESEKYAEIAKDLEKEPEGGKRCEMCFKLRLEETAKVAKEGGFDYFCSTLTVSPHKNAKLINEIGEYFGEKYGAKYLANDFKKENGFKRSVEISNEHELYRQRYCGCIYSKYAHIKTDEEE